MSTKEYLNQIQSCREYLRQLYVRKENLHINYSGISAIDYSSDRVQSSPENKLEEEGWKLAERIGKINEEIEQTSIKIDDISAEIYRVDNGGRYSRLLFLKYYDGKTLKEIATEIKTDYCKTCRLHGEALRAFGEIYNSDIQQGDNKKQ